MDVEREAARLAEALRQAGFDDEAIVHLLAAYLVYLAQKLLE